MAETTTQAAEPKKAGWLTKLFGFDGSKMKVSTEIIAGITTFLATSYILAVNPSILADTGMDKNALFTSTAIASIFATLVMALYAKLPFALAPGMGLNAFFCYSVCLGMGYSWQFALTAVLIEGLIFVILTLTNVREAIVNAIPKSMRNAIGAGIGLFIALIGLKSGGIVVDSPATLVDLGTLTSGPGLLSVIGLVLTGILVILNVPGALLIGIIATALIGI
ncbi:MAG: NCS2 family permease, partial [Bacteroidales bacterium]|nr:NCS2 family permease [Bacteroidales bacterium]